MLPTPPCALATYISKSPISSGRWLSTAAFSASKSRKDADSAAFLAAGGYHHHIAVNTWESLGGSPPRAAGLYHTAIVYPSRAALAVALERVIAARIPLEGAADHGVSESIYLRDPDGNGVELYCDRPQSAWPHARDGKLAMYTRPLDLEGLLHEAVPELSEGPQDL
jgi:catechol 2,3-dioxygenase